MVNLVNYPEKYLLLRAEHLCPDNRLRVVQDLKNPRNRRTEANYERKLRNSRQYHHTAPNCETKLHNSRQNHHTETNYETKLRNSRSTHHTEANYETKLHNSRSNHRTAPNCETKLHISRFRALRPRLPRIGPPPARMRYTVQSQAIVSLSPEIVAEARNNDHGQTRILRCVPSRPAGSRFFPFNTQDCPTAAWRCPHPCRFVQPAHRSKETSAPPG